jgi:glycosyltransferase involved in cell wall biosynthesis
MRDVAERRAPPRLVSVVMPVRNEEEHIGEQLAALASQSYRGEWELIVVDNGCRDRTIEIVRAWETRLPAVRIVDAPAHVGINGARNRGVVAARGEFIALCDGDDVADAGWLQGLVDAARAHDLVGGRQDLDLLNDEVARAWIGWRPLPDLGLAHHFLRYVDGGNMGVWASVARELGWDEDFRYGSSDIAFGWRAQLHGKRLGAASGALMHTRLRGRIRDVMRQAYRRGKSQPLLYRKFRAEGMRRNLGEPRYHWLWLLRNWRAPFSSRAERGRWLRKASKQVGRLVGSVRHRVFFP